MRIVSLVPSVTETLAAWDRTPIACTRFCERKDLEHVGGTKNPNIARIVELQPDLVVMDAEENRREDYDVLIERGLHVVALHVRSLEDVNPSMVDLARRVDASWEAFDVEVAPPITVSAFVPIWRRPWMALGSPTYGSSLLRHIGVRNVFDDDLYPKIELHEVAQRHPDVVLAPSEPYPFSTRHLAELESVATTTFVDGKDLFWWGVRTHGAMERLVRLVAGLSPRNRG